MIMKGRLKLNILVIDTSSNLCSLGIKYNDRKIFKTLDEGKTHSETLLPLIDSVLKENNISLDDINILGVVTGPGSFTGIRIGISTIKAVAFAKDIKVVEITSTEVLARNIEDESIYKIGIIDAKNEQIYAGIYTNEFKLLKEYAGDINDFINELKNIEIKISEDINQKISLKEIYKYSFAGTGIKHKEIIENKLDHILISNNTKQDIKKTLEGIEYKLQKKENIRDGKEITPNYLKPSNAERK